jgi:hypothetical protein
LNRTKVKEKYMAEDHYNLKDINHGSEIKNNG